MDILVPPEVKFWQGDIFSNVPWAYLKDVTFVMPTGKGGFVPRDPPNPGARAQIVTNGGSGAGILITHECVLDKDQSDPLSFARVMSIASRGQGMQTSIRNGEYYAIFYLPGRALLGESYVDFRFITTLDPALFPTLDRVASLNNQGRDGLRESLIRYWTRTAD